jgi:hypothetical protein
MSTCKFVKGAYCHLVFVLIALLPVTSSAQANLSDTIPYEIVREKMVITVKVNGLDARFIYDSGGRPWIMKSEADRLGIVPTGYTAVSDLNNKSNLQSSGNIKAIQLSKNYYCKNIVTVISGDFNYFKTLNVAGLLSNEFFSDLVVAILPLQKKLVLTRFRPSWAKREDGITVRLLPNCAFLVPLQLGGKTIEALFDTGMGHLFNISNQELKFADTSLISKVNSLYGVGGIGINGVPAYDTYYKIEIKNIKLGRKTFEQVGGMTQAMNNSIIGVDLLQYGNVILDIPRQTFYFYPFDNKPSVLDGAKETWNVAVFPVKDHFEISGIWGANPSKIAVGEKVININGRSLEGFPNDQEEIDQLMNKIQGNSAYLIVEKNKQLLKIEIEKVK